MNKYKLPYFGEVDFDNSEDYYEIETTIDESIVSITIDFEGEEPNKEHLLALDEFLLGLPQFITKVREAIDTDFESGAGFVRDYIGFFKESIKESGEYGSFVDETDDKKSIDEQLLSKLYLLRVGVYPNSGSFAVLDYTISQDQTDDLLVIYLTEKGELDGMTIES